MSSEFCLYLFFSLVCLSRLDLILQVRLSGHIVLYGFWAVGEGGGGGINLSSSMTVVKKKKGRGVAVLAASALSFLGLYSCSEN